LEHGNVGVGHDAAHDHGGVEAGIAQGIDHQRRQGQVRAVVHREADHVDVFLQCDRGDRLRRLPETHVDDLHACVAQDARHHLRTPVVAVEPDLAHEHPHGQVPARSV
jgi:hypothetical protein